MTNPLSAYRETRIRTASPGQLVLMLYAEAIRQCDIACELIGLDPKRDPSLIQRINAAVMKAQDIITELMASLDFEAGAEIAGNLYSLYAYFNRELMEANIAKEAGRIRPVRAMLEELRSAWVEAIKKAGDTAPRAHAGVNIAG
jgi:flagellar protein FliS